MVKVYLGLGSNLGDRAANLREAIRRLTEKVTIQSVSSLYETEPWEPALRSERAERVEGSKGVSDQPAFLNAACGGETNLSPQDLLQFTQTIERQMGRVPTRRWGPRLIDLDILLYGDWILNTPDLTLPHPRLTQRRFVLVPLAEIAAEVVHPGNHLSVRNLLARCEDPHKVRLLEESVTWMN